MIAVMRDFAREMMSKLKRRQREDLFSFRDKSTSWAKQLCGVSNMAVGHYSGVLRICLVIASALASC